MVCGGNGNAAAYFKAKGWNDDGGADAQSGAKFTSKAALAYRAHLEKEVAKNRDRLIDTLNESFGQDPAVAEAAAAAAALVKHDALDAEIAQLTLKSGNIQPAAAKPTPSPPPASAASPPAAAGEEDAVKEQPKAPVRTVIRKTHAPPAAAALVTDDSAAAAAASASAASAAAASSSGAAAADPSDLANADLASLLSTSKTKKTSNSAASMRSQLSTKKTVARSSILAGSSSSSSSANDEDPFEAAAREASESAARIQQEKLDAAIRAAQPTLSPKAKDLPAKKAPAKDEPDANLAKYSKSTSIGSDQFFERGSYAKADESDRARMSQFAGANAIGSAAYFGEEDDSSHHNEDPDLSDAVAQTVLGIKGLASGIFKGIQSRYG